MSDSMKVHLIRKETIEAFKRVHPSARAPFRAWLSILKASQWECPADILLTFGSADLLGNGCNRVVFDIGGNNFRMICHYVFGVRELHLFICWIGTHGAYTALCSAGRQYTVSLY